MHLALASRRAEFQRLVVVKTIREQSSHSAEARALFMEEARLSARLSHPNVVRVTEIVELEHGAMLVMEYLDGLCLGDALRAAGDAFTLPLRIRAICEALAGLHYAHRLTDFGGRPLGIVHRDVSPQNVFLTYDGCVKLLDFGIAKADDSEAATRTGILKGRIAYMSAEQIRGEALDCRADIYAMGCVLFEAVADRRLWGGLAQGEIVRAVAEGQVPRLDDSVDGALRAIVERAMAHSREGRFSTAEEMRLALEHYLESRPDCGQVLARDIGDMLAVTCAERREQRRQEIAEAIQRIERARSDAPTPVVPPPHQQMHLEVPKAARTPQELTEAPVDDVTRGRAADERDAGASSGTGTGLWRSDAQDAPPKGRGGLWVYAVPGVLLIAAAALIAPRLTLAPDTESAPAAEASAKTNRLVVEVEPSTATILLDGEAVGVGRSSSELTDGSTHVLRVMQEGYEAVERSFVSDADAKLEIELTPSSDEEAPRGQVAAAGPRGEGSHSNAAQEPEADQPSEDSEPSARSRRKTSPASSAPATRGSVDTSRTKARAAATESTNCKPPYYYSEGVKTYKPECI